MQQAGYSAKVPVTARKQSPANLKFQVPGADILSLDTLSVQMAGLTGIFQQGRTLCRLPAGRLTVV